MNFIQAVRDWDAAHGPPRAPPAAPAAFSGAPSAWARAALAAEVERVREAAHGTRNDSLNRAAFSLGQIVAGGGLDETEVAEALEDAGYACGLDYAEITATIRSGLRAGRGEPRAAPITKEELWPTAPPLKPTSAPGPGWAAGSSGGTSGEPGDRLLRVNGSSAAPGVGGSCEVEEAAADLLAAAIRALPRIDWAELWADDSEEEWIIEPLLPAGRLVALYSAPKLGKSLLLLEVAVAVARGVPVLGVTPDRARRVLYVDFENDPRGDVRERLLAMDVGPDQLDGLVYLSFPVLSALDSPRGGRQLLTAVEAYGTEVVVIDTISRAIAGEENENDTWLNFYRHTGMGLKARGVSLIRLDHTGKDPAKGQRGGSAKSGDVDAVWHMTRVTGVEDAFQLECEAARMPIREKLLVLYRREEPLRHEVDPAGRAALGRAKAAVVAGIVADIDATGLPDDAGRDRVVAALGRWPKWLGDAIKTRKERGKPVIGPDHRWGVRDL